MIREDGVSWVSQDGSRSEMSGVKIGTIEAGIELYFRAVGRIAEHEKEVALVAEGSLKKRATALTPEEVDTTDLDEASIINVDKGWMSQEVLDASALLWLVVFSFLMYVYILPPFIYLLSVYNSQVDFELTGQTRMTPKGLETREWTHKKCKYTFWQSQNVNKKTWQTGVWTKKLEQIAKGNGAASGNVYAITRAKYILMQRNKSGKTLQPVKGIGFFPFEEDVDYHIDEAIVIISTGSPLSFYDNPFVKTWLSRLNPRHRAVYRSKLAKLIRCVNDVMQDEVSTYNSIFNSLLRNCSSYPFPLFR